MNNNAEQMPNRSPRTMESAYEFGRCARGTRLVLSAFGRLTSDIKEQRQTSRLNARMLKVLQSDPVNGRGERTPASGDLSFLEGFDFFNKKSLLKLLYADFYTSIDRKTGLCDLTVPNCIAPHDISYDGNYTHVMFIAAAATLDFERETFTTNIVRSDYLNRKEPMSVLLQPTFPAQTILPVVLALGMEFYQLINGQAYRMGLNGPLSLHIVKTSTEPTLHYKKANDTGTYESGSGQPVS